MFRGMNRWGKFGFLCSILGLTASSQAQASELRFSETAAGNVVATGNTVGLSKETLRNGPGLLDGIGTFVALDPASVDDFPVNQDNPWFAGTTNDWTAAGSEATLVLPEDAEILYAELVWGGSFLYGTEDVSTQLDTPVTLAAGADSIDVSADPITALTIEEIAGDGFAANYYVRSADVTDFVAEHGAGAFTVSGIPATQDMTIDTLQAAGWTLIVAYRDSLQPIRNLTIFVGGGWVDEDSVEDYEFAGFCTPPSGPFDGFAVVSAMEGDANRTGDFLSIGQTVNDPFAVLEGPNNPADNFFGSQINDGDGMLDVTGSFGDLNHDAINGVNVSGGRQGWDITRVTVSSVEGQLSNGQTSAILRTETTGDSFVPSSAAFAIGVNAPDFSGRASMAAAAPTLLADDETSTITVSLENVGLVDADGLLFTAPLPTGLELESFAVDGMAGDIGGNPVDAAMLETGVDIGDVGPGVARQVELVVRSVGAPDEPPGAYVIHPGFTYDYVSCVGQPPLTEPHAFAPITIDYEAPPMGTTGGGETGGSTSGGGETSESDSDTGGEGSASDTDTATATATDTFGSDTDSDTDGDTAGMANSDDGCGCRSSDPTPLSSLLLLGLLGLRRRRRS